jgi:hypothetical protein
MAKRGRMVPYKHDAINSNKIQFFVRDDIDDTLNSFGAGRPNF